MAKQTSLPVTQRIKNPGVSFVNADGVAYKTLYTASADDAVVKGLVATSTDGTARNLKVTVNDTATDRVLGVVNVPINAGTTGAITAVDLLASALLPGLPMDQNGKRVLPLQGTYALKIAPLVAVTAAAQIDVQAMVEEY